MAISDEAIRDRTLKVSGSYVKRIRSNAGRPRYHWYMNELASVLLTLEAEIIHNLILTFMLDGFFRLCCINFQTKKSVMLTAFKNSVTRYA